MYDELVKRLMYCRNNAAIITDEELVEIAEEAADAIEEMSREIDIDNAAMTAMDAAMPRWIPVTETENLPNGEVLALNNLKGSYGYHEYLVGYVCENRESETGFLFESDGVVLTSVTHWQPLPKPPIQPVSKTDEFGKAEQLCRRSKHKKKR